MRRVTLILAAAALLGGARPAGAELIFDNLGPDNRYNPTSGWGVGGFPGNPRFEQAMAFTPSGGTFFLDRIELAAGLSRAPNLLDVLLMTSVDGAPGEVLEVFRFVNAMGPFGLNNPLLAADSALRPVLTEGTQYWLVASAPDLNTFAAWNENVTGHRGPHAFRTDGGAWQVREQDVTGAFRVAGTAAPEPAVPEPASVALLTAGGFLLLGLRGLRRGRTPRRTTSLTLEPLETRAIPAFLPAVPYATDPSYPTGVAAADFNGDGAPDLVTANYWFGNGTTLSVFLNQGDGSFGRRLTVGAGRAPYKLAAADFDGDGAADLAVVNYPFAGVRVLRGNGDGSFRPPVTYTAGLYASFVAAADLNGDGIPDLVTVHALFRDRPTVGVLLGNGDGSFQPATHYAFGAYSESGGGWGVAVGDLNGDGAPDLVTADGEGNGVSVLLNYGDGSFAEFASYPTGAYVRAVALADLNADDLLDVAAGLFSGRGGAAVLLGHGDGTFTESIQYGAGSTAALAAGDFDADGHLDLALADYSLEGRVHLLAGHGDGSFREPESYASGGDAPFALAAEDFNGDGFLDVAAVNTYSASVAVLLNDACWCGGPGGAPAGGVGTFAGAVSLAPTVVPPDPQPPPRRSDAPSEPRATARADVRFAASPAPCPAPDLGPGKDPRTAARDHIFATRDRPPFLFTEDG